MVRLRLAHPPAELDRDLVARIVPNPAAGAWEATVQHQVAQQGFATPTVRLTAPETSPLGRYLIVMDHIDGRPDGGPGHWHHRRTDPEPRPPPP